MDECLAYFRLAATNPASAPPWSQWWATNSELAAHVFSFADYVRLKHRRLRGARQILQRTGQLPADFQPPSHSETGSCPDCGERTTRPPTDPRPGDVTCPNCGLAYVAAIT